MNRSRRLLVVMDPIEGINVAKDTSLALLQTAAARGWSLHYATLGQLALRDGVAEADARALRVFDQPGRWFELGAAERQPMGSFDLILMRKDPPFDAEFIYASYILERAELAGALVVNRPRGLRDMNEKVYTAWFPQCCAPTLVTRDMAALGEFVRAQGKAVIKPLHGMGGRSIFAVDPADRNMAVIFETLTDYGQRYAMAQKYLPEIVTGGDSRVMLIDGEPVSHALARIPSPGDNRGNLAAGATGVARPLSERDRWLARETGPALREAGMLFVGLDVIGGFITEINVTSPTGVRELGKQVGIDVPALIFDAIDRRLAARR